MHDNRLSALKNLSIKQNVALQVIDQTTGRVVQEHIGHNSATNSLLFGIAHHLIGDFLPNETHGLNPTYSMLSNYVPRYISLGTMGLINQNQDANGLPAGVGDTVVSSDDPEYKRLQEELNAAKASLDAAKQALAEDCQYWPACDACAECNECANRIGNKRQAVEDAQLAYDAAYDAFMNYNEESRFVEYMNRRPGYGADGYDPNENNGRKYLGLGYAFTSYDNTEQYLTNDLVTYNGILYECLSTTPQPAGPFNYDNWKPVEDPYQPSLGTTIQLELISPSFPRQPIAYRDVVPEYQAELPKTIDVVFSAMISTGALKQFRPEGQDYIFITEAGLWSKKTWEDSGENGLLAGYRIVPPNDDNWDMTIPENREILKRNILKVGKNQVVQVVWKIQIGTVEKFEQDAPGLDYTTFYAYTQDTREDPVAGATFKITSDEEGQHTVDDAYTHDPLRWTSSDGAFTGHLNNGIYYMHYVSVPQWYVSAPYTQFVVIDGELTKLSGGAAISGATITNTLHQITHFNFAVASAPAETSRVAGAHIKITKDAEGEIIATDAYTFEPEDFDCGLNGRPINLLNGTYYIHMTAAPSGYIASNMIVFTADEGIVTKTSEAGVFTNGIMYMIVPPAQTVYVTDDGFTSMNAAITASSTAGSSGTLKHRVFKDSTPATIGYPYYYYEWDDGDMIPHAFNYIGQLLSEGEPCQTAFEDSNSNQEVISTTPLYLGYFKSNESVPIIGYYYCESPLGFKDKYNLIDTIDNGTGYWASTSGPLDLSYWDATNLSTLTISEADSLANGYDWLIPFNNTYNVTDLSGAFEYMGDGSILHGFEYWDTSNVTDMSDIFKGCSNMDNSYELDLHRWDTSNVTTLASAFEIESSYALFDLDLQGWDISNVTDLSNTFTGYSSDHLYRKIDTNVANWDTSNVTTMHNLFANVNLNTTDSNFTSLSGLANWNVSNVLDMSSMFCRFRIEGSSDVDYSPLNGWEAQFYSHVDAVNFEYMFEDAGSGATMPNWHGTFDGDGTFIPDRSIISLAATVTQTDTLYTDATISDIQSACTFVISGSDYWGATRTVNINECTITPTGPYTAGTVTLTLTCDSASTTFTVTISEPPAPQGHVWDFTNSLTDSQGLDATFFTHTDDPSSITTTPASGQYVSGEGVKIGDNYYALHIPVDLASSTISYTVEIDIADGAMTWGSWNSAFLMSVSVDEEECVVYSGLNSDLGAFTIDSYDANRNFHYAQSNITSETFFSNCTLKIINRVDGSNVVWDLYKDDTLFMTAGSSSEALFWDNSVLQKPFAISGGGDRFEGTITGMRIYENA